MKYYRMVMADENRWHLSIAEKFPSGREVDIWAYSRCERIDDKQPVPFRINVDGHRVDYNPTAFGSVVVSRSMGELLEAIAPREIQRIPAMLDDPGQWDVLNLLSLVDCIDHTRSIIDYHPADHPEKPSKPSGIWKLVIDSSRTRESHIFRPKDWEVVEIVSERVKNAFEENRMSGIEYWPVS